MKNKNTNCRMDDSLVIGTTQGFLPAACKAKAALAAAATHPAQRVDPIHPHERGGAGLQSWTPKTNHG